MPSPSTGTRRHNQVRAEPGNLREATDADSTRLSPTESAVPGAGESLESLISASRLVIAAMGWGDPVGGGICMTAAARADTVVFGEADHPSGVAGITVHWPFCAGIGK